MTRHRSAKRGRTSSWLTACFFPSSSGASSGGTSGTDECVCVFVVVADYHRQDDTDISLRAGERVEVIEKNDTGWWFVRSPQDQGWVPSSYLLSLTQNTHTHTAAHQDAGQYETVQAYKSYGEDEFGFDCGVTVEVVQKNLEGWWFIRYGGREGWAPASYLRKVQDDVLPAERTLTESRRTSEIGQVEIIGKLMDISNLLNRTHANEAHSANTTHTHGSVETSNEELTAHTDITINSPVTTNPNISSTQTNTPSCTHTDANSTTREEQLHPNTHSDTESIEQANSISDPNTHTNTTDGMSPRTKVCESTSGASVYSTVVTMHKSESAPAVARVSPQRVLDHQKRSPPYSQNYLVQRENSLDFAQSAAPEPSSGEVEYYTISEFHSSLSHGISFTAGQKAEVLKKDSGGWWYVQIEGQEGWAPCSYIDQRSKMSNNRRVNTLTRPSVPPPAPPSKKHSILPHTQLQVTTPPERRVYEEPQYDIPTGSSEPTPAGDAARLGQELQELEDEEEFIYKNGEGRHAENLRKQPSRTLPHRQFSGLQTQSLEMDQPIYDAPAVELNSLSGALQPSRNQPELQQQPEQSVQLTAATPDFNCLRSNLTNSGYQKSWHCTASLPPSCSSPSPATAAADATLTQLYRSTAEFQQGAAGELSLPAGVLVEVLEKQQSGWWFVRWGPQEGWVPTYFLQPVTHFVSHTHSSVHSESSKAERLTTGLEKNEQSALRVTLNQSHRFGIQCGKENPDFTKSCASDGREYASVTKHQDKSMDKVKAKDGSGQASHNDVTLSLQWKDEPLSALPTPCTPCTVPAHAGRSVPVSIVKPKPHLIHNNLCVEYISIADYHGDAESMAVPAGARLEVLQRNTNGWWFCRTLDGSRRGWVPSNFLQKRV